MMTLGEKIALLRKNSKKSQEDLAFELGVSRQSVSKWESDRSVPDLDKILLLSSTFGVSTDYLLKDEAEADIPYENSSDVESGFRKLSLSQAEQFLEAKKYTAPKIAAGVFLCIVSPICLLLLAAASESKILNISENAAAGIGLCVLLLVVAAAVGIFIFCESKTKKFAYISDEVFEVESNVTDFAVREKENFSKKYTAYTIVGIILCILSSVPLFAAICFTENDFIMVVCVCLILLIAAFGVVFIINAGIMQESFNKLLQEGDFERSKKLHRPLSSIIGKIYWPVVTAIYLAFSFVTEKWQTSWIIWPVSAVIFSAVITVAKVVSERKK
ncbi:MAG: helix-turn-helix domain-containing protein [Acutalibacteraceae bacterium]